MKMKIDEEINFPFSYHFLRLYIMSNILSCQFSIRSTKHSAEQLALISKTCLSSSNGSNLTFKPALFNGSFIIIVFMNNRPYCVFTVRYNF